MRRLLVSSCIWHVVFCRYKHWNCWYDVAMTRAHFQVYFCSHDVERIGETGASRSGTAHMGARCAAGSCTEDVWHRNRRKERKHFRSTKINEKSPESELINNNGQELKLGWSDGETGSETKHPSFFPDSGANAGTWQFRWGAASSLLSSGVWHAHLWQEIPRSPANTPTKVRKRDGAMMMQSSQQKTL